MCWRKLVQPESDGEAGGGFFFFFSGFAHGYFPFPARGVACNRAPRVAYSHPAVAVRAGRSYQNGLKRGEQGTFAGVSA